MLDLAFDDQVAALDDVDAILRGELRARERERLGGRGERAERIEAGARVGHALQGFEVTVQLVDQRLEERLLERERALARGERLVLEGLELRGDVALRVL